MFCLTHYIQRRMASAPSADGLIGNRYILYLSLNLIFRGVRYTRKIKQKGFVLFHLTSINMQSLRDWR